MRYVRSTLTALVLLLSVPFGPALASQDAVPRAVVELYTSEACNSCPPADAVLYQLNQERSDLLVLSYHVDYWNYLGWEDPFSDARYSKRQRDYAHRMRERYVYTPQVVINGNSVVPATQKQRIENTADGLAPLESWAHIRLTTDDVTQPAAGTIILNGDAPLGSNGSYHLWLVGFDREQSRDVLSGENAGRRLVHANVVREMVDLGIWNSDNRELDFALASACDGGVALLIQEGRGGPIHGVSLIRFNS